MDPSAGGSKLFASLSSFAILIAMAFLVLGLAPTDLPPDRGSNFIDTVFHNKGVILAARLLLVSAAIVLGVGGVFIVTSIAARIRHREWLKRAGPFEVDGTELNLLRIEREDLRTNAKASQEEVELMGGQIHTLEGLVEELCGELSIVKRKETDDER